MLLYYNLATILSATGSQSALGIR